MVRSVARMGVLCAVLTAVPTALADTVTYTVDSSQSRLTLSGGVASPASFFGFSPVATGSMETAFGGTITGNLSGSTLALSGGSLITALANPVGPFLPSGPGSVDAFGMLTNSFNGTAQNRMYDVILDLVSGTLANGVRFSGGVTYVGGGGVFPFFSPVPQSLLYYAVDNGSSSAVTFANDGSLETLTIPIDVILYAAADERNNVTTRLTGTIVASRAIPAPGAAVMLAMAGFAAGRRRR